MELKQALQELADRIKEEIIRRMHSNVGVNPRTGQNTLIGSDLEKSISVDIKGEDQIVFEIADYYEYVVTGWRRTGNFPGTLSQFVYNLTRWVRKKDIKIQGKSENQVVWAILKSIWTRGIRPRPFIESGYNNDEDPSKILIFLDNYFDKWSDETFEAITKELDKYFT